MPRHTKRATQREEVSLAETRPVQLQAGRRFFSGRGSDQATRQARALSEAFGTGLEFASEEIDRRNVAGAERALGAKAAGQEREEFEKNQGYNKAWDELDAEADIVLMESELKEGLRNFDWENKTPEEVRGFISNYQQENFAGVDPTGWYGQKLAPAMLALEAKYIAEKADLDIENIQMAQRSNLGTVLEARLEATGEFDYEFWADQTNRFWDGSDKTVVAWEILFETAEKLGRPDIIENAPDVWPVSGEPTGKNDTRMQADINNALAKATSVQQAKIKAAEDKFKADNQTLRAASHSSLTTRAKAGDASVLTDIAAGGVDGPEGQPRLLSRAQQKELFDQLTSAQLKGAVDSNNGILFGEARAYGLTETEYDNAAATFADGLDKKYADEHPEWSPERREAEVLGVVLERSYRHDRLPKFITDFINVSPSSPERFKQAANVKRQVDELDSTLVQRSISDRNAAIMDVYELTLADTGDEDTALEAVSQYDMTLSNGRQKEINEIADDALEDLAGDSGFFSGDYEITTKDRQRAASLTKHYINLNYSDDQAKDFVVHGMRGRNTRVNGVMYPVDAGWRKGDAAADWYLGTVAPDFFAEKKDMVIKPHPTKNGSVVIQDSSAMLAYASPEVKISEIEDAYQRSQDEQLVRLAGDAEATVSEGVKEAEKRAFDATFPPVNLTFLEPGARSDAMRRNREAWDNMSAANRERLIQAQMK
jgi:hypothetical protein